MTVNSRHDNNHAHLFIKTTLVFIVSLLFFSHTALAQDFQNGYYERRAQRERPDIVLEADVINYSENNNIVVAEGNVEVLYDNRTLMADKLIYDRKREAAQAMGNVVLHQSDGSVIFADKFLLKQDMTAGIAQNFGSLFSDGSRVNASLGAKKPNDDLVLRHVSYSPCKVCEDNPEKAPFWRIKASKMLHNKQDQEIYYHNARLEMFGIPVAYTPYLSHPSPEVVQRSGLLKPTFGFDNKLGTFFRNYYYYGKDRSTDATLETTYTSRQGALLGAEIRDRGVNGEYEIDTSINRSTRRLGSDDRDIVEPEDYRWHLFGEARYDIDKNWRVGADIRRTSDNFYLRDFDFYNADILQNRLYSEWFWDRSYADVEGIYFQDLRSDITQTQPDILPQSKFSLVAPPDSFVGGRLEFKGSLLNLVRDGDQSISRFSVVPAWENHVKTPGGLALSVRADTRIDNYWIRQASPFDTTGPQTDVDDFEQRFFPRLHTKARYPLIKPMDNFTALIEPIVSLTTSLNDDINSDIPNEDSRDTQLDISNLFESSRFPGFDRIENGTHVSYGFKVGGYDNSFQNSAFFTLGQSYQISGDNLFSNGSGLEDDYSDIVGGAELTVLEKYYLDYRFQLDEEDMDDVRHELQGYFQDGPLDLRVAYLFANELSGAGITEERQQIRSDVGYRFSPNWAILGDIRHDLTGEIGLVEAGLGLEYKNDCFRFRVKAERDLTDQDLGGGEDSIIFSLGFRNLGGFDEPLLDEDERLFDVFEED